MQIKKGPRFERSQWERDLLLALVNHTRGGLSWLSINNGRIPWFRDRAITIRALFGGFESRWYFVTLLGNEQ